LSEELLPAAPAGVTPGFEQLRRLTEVSRALTYTTSLDQVTRFTVRRGAELLDGPAAVLMLADADGLLQVRAAHGIDEDQLSRFSVPLDDDLTDRLRGLLGVAEDRFIAVPLVAGGQMTGLLAVTTSDAYTASEEWLLSALADQAAVALENARLTGEVRIEMEERLQASEGATSAKDQALATLAHDIRTPLGAIDGYCCLLEEGIHGPLNDRQLETLGRIRLSGAHLLSLLDNVMEMARLNAGAVRVSTERVRLVEVAREAVQILLPAAEAKLQTVEFAPDADPVVLADHGRLRQVVINLIGNAVKFTPDSGRIEVQMSLCTEAGAAFAEISVRDTGPGIPESEQQAIFAPYFRSSATEHIEGVGLGLAISRALVEQMGGELLLQSAAGAGACFTVRLPLAD
jgi:phosphoserine phosphatase RsbU/P